MAKLINIPCIHCNKKASMQVTGTAICFCEGCICMQGTCAICRKQLRESNYSQSLSVLLCRSHALNNNFVYSHLASSGEYLNISINSSGLGDILLNAFKPITVEKRKKELMEFLKEPELKEILKEFVKEIVNEELYKPEGAGYEKTKLNFEKTLDEGL